MQSLYPVEVRIIIFLAILCVAIGEPRAQPSVLNNSISSMVKHVHRNGQSFFEIRAGGFIRATPQQTWQVLTDYERLPEFVPKLQSSRIISRNGNETVLDQQSTAGIWFASQTIRLTLLVTEQPYSEIDVKFLAGDMKHFISRWEIAPAEKDGVEGTHLVYSGEMEPEFFVPPMIGDVLVESDVKQMLQAVSVEVVRRESHESSR